MKRGLRSTDTVFSQRSNIDVLLLCLALLFSITAINYMVGFEITLSQFFLIPIVLATWHGDYRLGVLFSIISALTWLLTDISTHHYQNTLAPYLNTGIRLALFLAAAKLAIHLKTLINIEQRKSRTDPLTGLMNKGGFTELAERTIAKSLRHSRPTTFAYIDLDNFKKMNDEQGHSMGDSVLQTIGETFLKSSRKTDIMGRLGEDDFALILPETNRLGAQVMLNRLRTRYAAAINWPVSFSIGVITYDLPPENYATAIKMAHSLMLQAKQDGNDNTVFDYYPREQQSSYQISYGD